jgi:mRNA interferase RelE/StbE
MKFTVNLSPPAELSLKKLDKGIALRVTRKYVTLADNPRPSGCEKLVDVKPDTWRVRAGDWRVLYDIDDAKSVVTILDILPRDKAYKS